MVIGGKEGRRGPCRSGKNSTRLRKAESWGGVKIAYCKKGRGKCSGSTSQINAEKEPKNDAARNV